MLPLWLLPVFQRGVPGQPGLPAAQFLEAVPMAQPICRSLCLLLCPRLQSPASTAIVHIEPCLHEEPILCGTTASWPCEDHHPRPCPPRVSYPTQLFPFRVTVRLAAPQQVRAFLLSSCLNFTYVSSLKRSPNYPVKKKNFWVHEFGVLASKQLRRLSSASVCCLPSVYQCLGKALKTLNMSACLQALCCLCFWSVSQLEDFSE